MRSAFTITELLVVIAIVALILAVVVPGLSGMLRDARTTSAVATTAGLVSRAYLLSQADSRMTAVRAVPAEWDRSLEVTTPVSSVGRQHLALYSYSASSGTLKSGGGPGNLDIDIEFAERFERKKEVDSVELPADVWVAPIEMWRYSTTVPTDVPSSRHPLSGTRGKFEFDATAANNQFVDADDFLIVFDPQTGLRQPTWSRDTAGSKSSSFALKAFDPGDGIRPPSETDRLRNPNGTPVLQNGLPVLMRRINSGGFIFYSREQFAATGTGQAGAYEALFRRIGRPYLVQRYGGGLIPGAPK